VMASMTRGRARNVELMPTALHIEYCRQRASAGGAISAQLAHSDAVSHPDFFSVELPPAPSEVNPRLRSFTSEGFKDTVTPRAMSVEEIASTIANYGAAAKNARNAGFDGVELHAATTYLLPEFLNSALNIREDANGGSAENRTRIVLESSTHSSPPAASPWADSALRNKPSPTTESQSKGGLAVFGSHFPK
jgi:N-ethylmaleimide reductase